MTIRGLLRAREGSVSAETALVMTFVLIPMLVGIWDVGQLFTMRARLEEAVRGALTVVANNPALATSTDTIVAAGQAGATGFPVAITPTLACYCIDQSSPALSPGAANTCGVQCAHPLLDARYITIQATATTSLLFPAPFLPSSVTMSASDGLRYQ